MGTFIGMVISVTLILQFNLFSEIPFELAVNLKKLFNFIYKFI